jgi:hypothetical protein
MSPTLVGLVVFVCLLAGWLLGSRLRALLPEHHLGGEPKEVAKLASGLIATMAALVLGLLVASAKDSYDSQSKELTQISANVVVLDRMLAHYGPEATPVRGELRRAVEGLRARVDSAGDARAVSPTVSSRNESLYETIQALAPKDDEQRSLKSAALGIATTLGETRWLMYEQRAVSVSTPLLVVLACWLTIIFVTFGLFARSNPTLMAIVCAAALAVSGAIFLILEMYEPYSGVIRVSSAPLRAALENLGR